MGAKKWRWFSLCAQMAAASTLAALRAAATQCHVATWSFTNEQAAAVLIAVLSVWHVGAVGLVLERAGRARAVVAHALPGQERRCGLLVGGVAVGARSFSFVADAAALRGADIVSYRSRPLLPRQRATMQMKAVAQIIDVDVSRKALLGERRDVDANVWLF